jgi:hypothetical protein
MIQSLGVSADAATLYHALVAAYQASTARFSKVKY